MPHQDREDLRTPVAQLKERLAPIQEISSPCQERAKNLAAFAAASRKAKSSYKTAADLAKAKTTQISVSLCLHLGTGFPAFWNLGGSRRSGIKLNLYRQLERKKQPVLSSQEREAADGEPSMKPINDKLQARAAAMIS